MNHSTSGLPSITNSRSLLTLMCIGLVMPSSHLILCCPLLLLPPIPPSTRVFSNESTLHMRWPKHWSFSLSISPSNEHPGVVSFRMDLLDLLAVQGTLKSLLQHRSSKASILQHSAFFTVQLSHPYMTTAMVFPVVMYGRESWTVKYMGICKQLQITSLYFFIPISRGLNSITACVRSRFQVASPKDTKSWSTQHCLEITRHGHRGMLLNTWSPQSAIMTVFWASPYGPHFNFDSLWWTMLDSWSP